MTKEEGLGKRHRSDDLIMHFVELLNNFTPYLTLPFRSLIVLWSCHLGAIAPAVPSYWNAHLQDCTEAGFLLSSITFYHHMVLQSSMALIQSG